MTCHAARRRAYDAPPLTEDQLATFLDLARQGDEVTFKELARCLGIEWETMDEFWTTAVTREATGSPPPKVDSARQ